MNDIIIKEVPFNGTRLMAAQDRLTGKIYAGVKWMGKGIGLSDGQYQNENRKIQQDLVLKQGVANLQLPTKGGNQEVLCLELDFVPLWLAKITITPAMQAEQTELTERLIEYQLKAKDVLAEAFLTKVIRRKPKDVSVKQHLCIATLLIQITGVSKEIAYAVAIEEAEKETGEDLTAYKKLLPSVEHEVGFLSPTLIGQRINMTSREVNALLEKLNFQYKDDKKEWRLTEKGKPYAEEFPYKRNNHAGYQIRWNESIVNHLRERWVG